MGSVQLRTRILGKLGFTVIDIDHDKWDSMRGDELKQQSLRELLQPHFKQGSAEQTSSAQ